MTTKKPAVVRVVAPGPFTGYVTNVMAKTQKEALAAARAVFEARVICPEAEAVLFGFEQALYREAERPETIARPVQRKGKR